MTVPRILLLALLLPGSIRMTEAATPPALMRCTGPEHRQFDFWVGGDGVVLRLEGGLQGRAMVMTGELPAKNGGVQRQRISWTPQDDGSLVQQWDTSDDDGATWSTSFRGTYRKSTSAAD
jgi:hypothetical protein